MKNVYQTFLFWFCKFTFFAPASTPAFILEEVVLVLDWIDVHGHGDNNVHGHDHGDDENDIVRHDDN